MKYVFELKTKCEREAENKKKKENEEKKQKEAEAAAKKKWEVCGKRRKSETNNFTYYDCEQQQANKKYCF